MAGGSRASVSSNNPRPGEYNRTNSAPDPGESAAEVPSERSRMRVVRRRSTSSGLFSGLLPGMRSRTASIVSTQQGSQRNLMRGSEIHLEEEENFPFKEVKRKPLEHDVELEEMIIKRRESQRRMNFLHRQDSTPLLMNVERRGGERRVREQPPPYQFPILETPFSRCFRDGSLKRGPSEEESETSSKKRRYRGLFRFHPFKGRCGLEGLTKGVGEINSRNEKVDRKFPFLKENSNHFRKFEYKMNDHIVIIIYILIISLTKDTYNFTFITVATFIKHNHYYLTI